MFPIVQDQWLNILLLNEFEFSYYSILYYLSGFLFPTLIINNSLNNFAGYKFNSDKYPRKKIKFISYLVTFNILILSLLIIRYFTFSIKYIIPQFDFNIYFDIRFKIFLLLIVSIFLLIKKTRSIIKKLFLLNFFIICFVNWTIYFFNLQGIEIFINKYISNNSYYEFNNLNIVNIFYLLIFEIIFYFWSFITNENNLSDWSINYPKKLDIIPISKIIIYYLGALIYYYIFYLISK